MLHDGAALTTARSHIAPSDWRLLIPRADIFQVTGIGANMAEIRTVTTLRSKRDEVLRSIRLYERQLEQARADLAHITAAIAIFEASGDRKGMAAYVDVHRLFRRGEPLALCKVALAKGPMTTRQLALCVMTAKGLNCADKVLTRKITNKLVHALQMQANRHALIHEKRAHNISFWQLPGNNVIEK